ncbi:caspase family protein [Kitasatospora sp. NPDC101235]|uniref:caspase, EACC1-associated type n=1 Tax=Kitasatospora sp. NPDC101235 TaxID=3364101 RepID=UPI00382B0D17
MSELPGPPHFADSRAILIGTGTYRDTGLSRLPAALNSLRALRRTLTDPRLCGWPEERVTVIEDAADMPALVQTLRLLARETRGVLLLYYVGHGLVRPRGQLCLTLAHTSPEHADVTGLDFEKIREAFLDSPAKVKAVVLDCCFAGRAIEALAGEAAQAASTDILGTYILTASDRTAHVVPLAEQADRTTSFTGTMVDLVRSGLPEGPEWLTLDALYPYLRDELIRRGLPVPNRQGTDTAGRFAFTRNPAHRPAPARASRLARALAAALAECADVGPAGTGQLAEATGHSPEQVEAYLAGRTVAPGAFLDGFAAHLSRLGRPPAPSRLRELHDLRAAELRDSPDPADQVVYLREVTEELRRAIDALTAERDEADRARADEQERARLEAERLAEQLAAEQERSRRLQAESAEKGRQLNAAAGLNRALEADLAHVREQAELITRELLVLRRQVEHLLDPPDSPEPADALPAAVTAARSTAASAGGAQAVTDRIPSPPAGTPPPRQTAPPAPRRPRRHGSRFDWRNALSPARVVAQALLVLTGLSTVALGFSWYVDAYDDTVAYRSAPLCGAPGTAPGTGCTTQETGRVTGKKTDQSSDSTTYDVTVSREAAPTAAYSVTEELYDSVENGTNVDLTLWKGRVVQVSHQGHRSAVVSALWLTSLKLALLVGLGTIVSIYGLLGRRLESWGIPLTVLPFLVFLTFIGSVILLIAQWPFAVTLAVPVIAWLVLTAIATVMSWEG